MVHPDSPIAVQNRNRLAESSIQHFLLPARSRQSRHLTRPAARPGAAGRRAPVIIRIAVTMPNTRCFRSCASLQGLARAYRGRDKEVAAGASGHDSVFARPLVIPLAGWLNRGSGEPKLGIYQNP